MGLRGMKSNAPFFLPAVSLRGVFVFVFSALAFSLLAAPAISQTVAITAPAPGSTVSGTVTVSANVSPDIVGVQFLLDDVALGAEVTTAPYSITWDTRMSADGSHRLSALAHDAADTQVTAAPVTVAVLNTNAPRTGQWAGPFGWPLVAINMVLLRTGDILVWDGNIVHGGLSARVWHPASGTFSAVPISGSNIFCAGQAALADGRILVVGGNDLGIDLLGIADANIFDPVTQTWTAVPPMAFARWYPTATTLGDGRVLVTSGVDGCENCFITIPEIYDPTSNTWTQLTDASVGIPVYPIVFLLPNGRVLTAGSTEETDATRILDVQAQRWTTMDPVGADGLSAVMYGPGKIMKSGSSAKASASIAPAAATTYVLDMNQASPRWRQTAPMVVPRAFHNLTLLPDGSALVTGGGRTLDGIDETQAVLPAEIWSPVTETWSLMAAMKIPRLYHSTALLLPDGRVLVAGSGHGGPPEQLNAEIYSPPYLFKGPRPIITSAPASAGYGSQFYVQTPNASAIASVSLIRASSVTHGFNQDQRFQNLAFQQAPRGLTVQAPLHSNLAPPGYYLLFLVDTNGVPSVACFVQLR